MLLAICVVVTICQCGQSTNIGKEEQPQAPAAKKDKKSLAHAVLETAVKSGLPGAVVLVGQKGEVIYEGSEGKSSLQFDVPMSSDTKFRIGSVTTLFTTAAVLKLKEQGKVRLDDPISRYIPDYPKGAEITIENLLTHTSGIPNHTQKPDFWRQATMAIPHQILIDSIKKAPRDFRTGRFCMYSSSGFELVGEIVSMVSGISYEEYLQREIMKPLGLKSTGLHDGSAIYQNLAEGYSFYNEQLLRAEQRDASHFPASGGLYSTANDLFHFVEALFAGKLLMAKTVQEMTAPAKLKDGRTAQWGKFQVGYGIGIRDVEGKKEYSNGGGFNGYDTWIAYYPDIEMTVIVLTNCNPYPEGTSARELADELSSIFRGAGS